MSSIESVLQSVLPDHTSIFTSDYNFLDIACSNDTNDLTYSTFTTLRVPYICKLCKYLLFFQNNYIVNIRETLLDLKLFCSNLISIEVSSDALIPLTYITLHCLYSVLVMMLYRSLMIHIHSIIFVKLIIPKSLILCLPFGPLFFLLSMLTLIVW